jgi:hypothetical protein
MRGIPRDIALALGCAALAAFYLAMIWAGIKTAILEPRPRRAAAPDTEAPCPGTPSPAAPAASQEP